jgi:hypothetical protein
LTLNEIVEDIMGQEVVFKQIGDSQKPVAIRGDLLKGD